MKKLLLFMALAGSCQAQLGNVVMKFYTSDPAGVKCSNKQMATLVSDGSLYNCDPTTHAFVGVGGGGISGLTTGYLPKAASASSLTNSSCDEGITSANILTCADSGGMVIASDGTHAGALGLIGNTTLPTITDNNFWWLGPNSASFTKWGVQMSTSPAGAGIFHVGAVDGTTKVAQGTVSALVASEIPAIQGTLGTSRTVANKSEIVVCTNTCTVTPLAPALGNQLCVFNGDNVSSVITLAALGSGNFYENTARTSYGTANQKLVSGGAVKDMICIVGIDSTHYISTNFIGTWTDTP